MFHDLTISAVRRETDDSVVLSFDIPTELADAFAYRPGQYLTLRGSVAGEDIRRSYSIASVPGAPLCVGIRHVEGGAFSSHAQTLEPGAKLAVMPPEGRFTLGEERDLLLIAAGSGVTPMVAIAGAALARGARVTMVLGNRRTDSIMFRSALDALKDRYMDRFTMIHILSREPQDIELMSGRITGDRIAALANAGAIAPDAADGIFLCGPGGMIDEVTQALGARGVAPERIHFERFYQDGETPPIPRSPRAEAAAAAGVAVSVLLDGTRRTFRFEAEDTSIVTAAERQGLELPYSCKGGMCCTCRCKVTDGSAEMATNYSLEQWELEAGFTLACQARPTSDTLALDFDAA